MKNKKFKPLLTILFASSIIYFSHEEATVLANTHETDPENLKLATFSFASPIIDPIVNPEPEPTPEPEPSPTPEPEPKPEPVPEPEPKPEPVPQPKPEPKPEPVPQPVPAPQPKPEPKPEPVPQPQPDPESELELAPVTIQEEDNSLEEEILEFNVEEALYLFHINQTNYPSFDYFILDNILRVMVDSSNSSEKKSLEKSAKKLSDKQMNELGILINSEEFQTLNQSVLIVEVYNRMINYREEYKSELKTKESTIITNNKTKKSPDNKIDDTKNSDPTNNEEEKVNVFTKAYKSVISFITNIFK